MYFYVHVQENINKWPKIITVIKITMVVGDGSGRGWLGVVDTCLV